jgi:hypothetical protein
MSSVSFRGDCHQGVPHERARSRVDARLIEEVRFVYSCLVYELENLDEEENEVCLLVSNFADDVAGFLSGLDLVREASL